MSDKLNIGIIFGGKSGEYDVSLMSAYNVIKGINKDKYNTTLIGITLEGKWYLYSGDYNNLVNNKWIEDRKNLRDDFSFFSKEIMDIDVFFPVVHGQNCEDGKLQGIFESINKAYVGCDVLSSACCMDKDITKIIAGNAGVPVTKSVTLLKSDIKNSGVDKTINLCEEKLGYPMFVKPVNMGSSVGISKAKDSLELEKSLNLAMEYDNKILVEEAINAREIEIAVLGNSEPRVSECGEIVACNEFYDYEAKYLSGDSSTIHIPAKIDKSYSDKIKEYGIKAYKALGCSGLSRVDFFIDKDSGAIYLNEINTMPGFTNISMYSKMWEHSGISYSALIDNLIDLAVLKYREKQDLSIK